MNSPGSASREAEKGASQGGVTQEGITQEGITMTARRGSSFG